MHRCPMAQSARILFDLIPLLARRILLPGYRFLEFFIQYFDPVVHRHCRTAPDVHEASYVGGRDPGWLSRLQRGYLVF